MQALYKGEGEDYAQGNKSAWGTSENGRYGGAGRDGAERDVPKTQASIAGTIGMVGRTDNGEGKKRKERGRGGGRGRGESESRQAVRAGTGGTVGPTGGRSVDWRAAMLGQEAEKGMVD